MNDGEAARHGLLREGPCGSMWAAHADSDGAVSGWEERGLDWRGFASGGAKGLFRLGSYRALRVCVTEAAIGAMSLAALEGMRNDSVYLSTGGDWSPVTSTALQSLAARPYTRLVAATDDNSQGEMFAERLLCITEKAGCDWIRLAPRAEDWNVVLCEQVGRKNDRGKGMKEAGYRMSAGRIKGEASPAAPTLDPAERKGGRRGGV